MGKLYDTYFPSGTPTPRKAAIYVTVTKTVTKPKVGRPKRYETLAEKQRAYRERKKATQ